MCRRKDTRRIRARARLTGLGKAGPGGAASAV